MAGQAGQRVQTGLVVADGCKTVLFIHSIYVEFSLLTCLVERTWQALLLVWFGVAATEEGLGVRDASARQRLGTV